MASIFSRIVAGEIPCHKVLEDEHFLAFLDIDPLRAGHTLVIPKQEVDYLFDVDDALLSAMLPFAKQVAIKIKRVVPCRRVGMLVLGMEVPHAHLHLVPINAERDLDLGQARPGITPEQLAEMAELLRKA
ncbi:MAG: HIT family protein [Flavobacteriales bacterium]|nr:HIT family protein [Flavobacteriales bacterium]